MGNKSRIGSHAGTEPHGTGTWPAAGAWPSQWMAMNTAGSPPELGPAPKDPGELMPQGTSSQRHKEELCSKTAEAGQDNRLEMDMQTGEPQRPGSFQVPLRKEAPEVGQVPPGLPARQAPTSEKRPHSPTARSGSPATQRLTAPTSTLGAGEALPSDTWTVVDPSRQASRGGNTLGCTWYHSLSCADNKTIT